MARLKNIDNDLKESMDLGKRSNYLIPKIKNWCSNINIHSEYGGLMGGMGLPTMNTVSCTEFNGDMAMNLEWIAKDFIIDHCANCKFHKEVNPNNFGREVLAEHKKWEAKIQKENELERKIIDDLDDKLKTLIAKKENTRTTELSIIKLLLSLNKPRVNKTKKSVEILEASKISPEFFNSLSLDYLTIYFKDADIRENIINAAHNVIIYEESLISTYFFEKVLNLLKSEFRLEILIKIIPYNKLNKNQACELIPFLIEKYDLRGYESNDYFENHSPSIISFFKNFYNSNEDEFFKTLRVYLKKEETNLRANATLILYQLFLLNHQITLKITPDLIRALNLNDSGSPKSADYIILKTLFHISEVYPQIILDNLYNEFSTLTLGGKIEVIKFHSMFVQKNIDSSHQVFIKKSIDELLKICLNKSLPQELRTEAVESIDDISQEIPKVLFESADSIIATLSQSIINITTFKWYLEDLDTKTLTFNPLLGRNIFELQNEQMTIENEIYSLKSVLKNLLKFNQNALFEKLLEIINNTNEGDENSGQLKLYFIEVIRNGISDSILLTNILPQLHTWLLDFKNLKLRIEALKFLEKLLKDNFHIIPQTLFNLLRIFIDDDELIIKRYAISCYSEILRNNGIVEDKEIDLLLNLYYNKYRIIHKNATDLSYRLLNVLEHTKRLQLLQSLLMLLDTYHKESNRDIKFCIKLFNQIMFISKKINNEHQKTECYLIKNYLVEYCNDSDYYRCLEALKKLTLFKEEKPKYNRIWLEQILKFNFRVKPQPFEPFSRSDKYKFYTGIFSLSRDDFYTQSDFIKNTIKEISIKTDVFNNELVFIMMIFSYFNMNEDILEIIEFFETNVKCTKAKDHFFKQLKIFKNLAQLNLINELELTKTEKKLLLKNNIDSENEIIRLQANIAQRKIILFETFKIQEIGSLLKEKQFFTNKFENLLGLAKNTFEESFFTNIKYLNTSIFLLLEWVEGLFEGSSKAVDKLRASKLNISLIDLEYFSYLPEVKTFLGEISKSINSINDFNEEKFKNIISEFSRLKIPFIHHLRDIEEKPYSYNIEKEEIEKDNIHILSLELYLKNNPWANPQILKAKEIYTINGIVKLNKVPNGYESLRIQPATTNSNMFELNINVIELTDDLSYKIEGNILFNHPQSSIEDFTSIKLIPYFANNESHLCPTIIGYDELITKVLDENNELFRTGFNMMNKKVFELSEHSYVKQLDNLEKSNLFTFLNGIVNYQGYCLQSGKYKSVSIKKENEFRDELIQHLVANPNIGEAITKESEVAGGRVEISYNGIVAELKVEKKLSERKEIINKYSNQALSYSTGNSKLVSIVCILDLTEKISPPSPGTNNIIINSATNHGFSKNEPSLNPFQIFVFIDGNTKNPSEYSK
tara:strand:- start:102 stop:4268 length:4167 start_codon:yes stop_codon:yes gene_type:complete